nr:MAG TPA: PORTAL PROTEIN [Caudoviricetes sp.]
MKTYQDLQEAVAGGKIGEFLRDAVNMHRGTAAYKNAVAGMAYYSKHNLTIEQMQKTLFTLSGNKTPDIWSSDYRLKSLMFRRLITQEVGYVLGNGVSMAGKERLGVGFDNKLQTAAKLALAQGKAFGFWNLDHLEVFSFADTAGNPGFVPLFDESTGEMMAGIRYWYRDTGRKAVFRATLYEPDGVSEWSAIGSDSPSLLAAKRGYIRRELRDDFGVVDQCDENYTRLPIAILYGNDTHESELVGLRESIDCYDFVKSGFANQIDEAGVYWLLHNTGAMDDPDLAKFIQRMRSVRAAVVDDADGTAADAHTVDVPVEARKTMLEILRRDLYEDAQMLDVASLSAAEKTATEIAAAYQPQDNKCADFEYFLIDFILQIGDIAGIPGQEPKFTWNKVINQEEITNMVLSAAEFLDDETVLNHLPWILPEEVPDILKRRDEADLKRMGAMRNPFEQQEQQEQETEEQPEV